VLNDVSELVISQSENLQVNAASAMVFTAMAALEQLGPAL
jgi:hypothetical protein